MNEKETGRGFPVVGMAVMMVLLYLGPLAIGFFEYFILGSEHFFNMCHRLGLDPFLQAMYWPIELIENYFF
jgi:hypothetical protein